MSNMHDLNELRKAVDAEFAPYTINVDGETLVLRNLLRVSDGERKTVQEGLAVLNASREAQEAQERGEAVTVDAGGLEEAVTNILRAVTANGKGDKLVKELAGDLALSMKVLEGWIQATQSGEASNSQA